MSEYSNFEEFMQASINAAYRELEGKYGISFLDSFKKPSANNREIFAEIIKSTVYGSHNYEQRFNRLRETGQDIEPLVNECASSIMLKIVLSNII